MSQREGSRRRARRERGPFQHSAPQRVHRLALSGALGYDSAAAFEAAVDELCTGGIDRLVLDLSALEAIDRTGVEVIAMRCRLCGRRGVAVEVAGARPAVASAFAAAGFAGELPFRENSFADGVT